MCRPTDEDVKSKAASAPSDAKPQTVPSLKISVSDQFDSGNIEVAEGGIERTAADSFVVHVNVKPDPYTELEKMNHMQYFCFRSTLSGLPRNNSSIAECQVTYSIDNANKVSYPEAWPGTTVFYTHNMSDSDSWKRVLNTTYDSEKGTLRWTLKHTHNGSVYFSYFPPYTYNQHLELIAKCQQTSFDGHHHATVESLGQTKEGRDIDVVVAGHGKTICWVIHRQHPGETQASFYAEGFLTRLLGLDVHGQVDGLVSKLLRDYTFYVVPLMCPDGAVRGHLRTNAVGANLNREWTSAGSYQAPTMERSPEVYAVLEKMTETGCDAFIDVHGDEELPYNFLVSGDDVGPWCQRLASLHGIFTEGYVRANSDMQKDLGYGKVPREEEHTFMNAANSEVQRRFNCFATTLEMPYKDCATNPDPTRGWSPHRCRLLGASLLDALQRVHPYLREEGEFWNELGPEDAYICHRHPDIENAVPSVTNTCLKVEAVVTEEEETEQEEKKMEEVAADVAAVAITVHA